MALRKTRHKEDEKAFNARVSCHSSKHSQENESVDGECMHALLPQSTATTFPRLNNFLNVPGLQIHPVDDEDGNDCQLSMRRQIELHLTTAVNALR